MTNGDPQLVTVAREAMATRFEIAMHGDDAVALRAAAEEALDEVQRVESMLSWRKPTSPAAHINARAAVEPVRVNAELFGLLKQCRTFWEKSEGAFDITVGPLMHAYGFHRQDDALNDEEEIAAARAVCGMQHVELNDADRTVRFLRPGMRLDFGAIGKGYALDIAVEILREVGVSSALVHGGTSTVCAIGSPPNADHWKVAVEYPPGDDPDEVLAVLSVIGLRDTAMSVSAVWGRWFRVGQDTFGHVIDPRTGVPIDSSLLSIYVDPSATECDAMSTALLVDGEAGIEWSREMNDSARTLVLQKSGTDGDFCVHAHDIEWKPRTQ